MISFQHIEYLLLLALIPIMGAVFYFLLRWKKNTVKRIGDPQLVKQLLRGRSSGSSVLRFILIMLAFILCVFAVTNLRKQSASGQVSRKGIDVVIALDVSKSMLAEDVKPNRLERAKQTVARIIDKLGDDRIGLVIFAGRAYLQMPVTTDHSAARLYLSGISPDDVPTQGTVISQALNTCYAAFNQKEKKYRAVILITDGEDHDDEALAVTKQMASEGIMINTVGIGSPDGAHIPDVETGKEKTDENGNPVISKLNEKELIDIAKTGNGIYQHFTSSDEVAANLRARLAGIGETTIIDSSTADYKYYFVYFLAAALLLLIVELFTGASFRSKKKQLALTVISCVLLSLNLSAQTTRKDIITGNKAYRKESYPDAIKSYKKALERSSTNEIAAFNLGNAFYKSDNNDEAIRSYESVISKSKDSNRIADAWYNKGVAHQKQKQNAEAIDAYKKTLKIRPEDEEARQNLQRLLQEMKQQQQKQDKKDKQDKKQDQKKDQKKEEEKKDQKEEQPKPQPSKMNKQDAEEKLKALLQHEKDLQDKLRRAKVAGPDKPKKDW